MTEKEINDVITDDAIKAVASAIMAACDAILEVIPKIKEVAENGEMNDLIALKLIEYVVDIEEDGERAEDED